MASDRRVVPAPTRVPLLVILILATLMLAGLLANEAHQTARFHQVTAERALADYAGFAAWELVAAAEENVHLAVAEALSPATGRRASSPYEHVPPPEILLPAAGATLRCPGDVASRYYFRLDFRDGAVTTSGAQSSPALLRHLADTVTADYRRSYRPDWRYAIIFDSTLGRDRAIVYGVLFAEFHAPIAAYGFVTCASAFGQPLFTRALEHVALFPNSSGRGTGGDSLVALTVTLPGGRELFRSGTTNALPFAGTASMERLGGLMVRAALKPEAAARLALGRSVPGRLPILIGMLAVTAALAGVALLQFRREHELARLRADFTSSVSHELRTPLAQILLFGETLSFGRARSDAERRVAAETIVQETRRLIHMVENLLHFARSERGLDVLHPETLLLAPLLRSVLSAFRPLADSAGARLEEEFDESAMAEADPQAFRQIVLNLLDNAIKYGPAGGRIIVRLTRINATVRLSVEDEGPGIPESGRDEIWQPFVRLRREHGMPRGGSGIGLAVVRDLALRQQGDAHVETGARGARFVVTLPAVPNESHRGEKSTTTTPPDSSQLVGAKDTH